MNLALNSVNQLDRDWDNGNGGKKRAINVAIKSIRKTLKDAMEQLPQIADAD